MCPFSQTVSTAKVRNTNGKTHSHPAWAINRKQVKTCLSENCSSGWFIHRVCKSVRPTSLLSSVSLSVSLPVDGVDKKSGKLKKNVRSDMLYSGNTHKGLQLHTALKLVSYTYTRRSETDRSSSAWMMVQECRCDKTVSKKIKINQKQRAIICSSVRDKEKRNNYQNVQRIVGLISERLTEWTDQIMGVPPSSRFAL